MGKKFIFNPFTGRHDIVAGQEENCLLAMSAPQYSVNAGVTINLVDNIGSGITVNNNIVFNNGTHRAILKAGKTYKLQAFIKHNGSATNTGANYSWYDVTNSQFIGKINSISSMDATNDDGTQPTTTAIITPSTDIEVELRCEWVSLANQAVWDNTTHATIEKISETFTNVITVGSIDEKLKRVDNDLFETAQKGVEYYSPVQQGRIYGIVYRKYFDIVNASGVGQTIDIPLGVTITQFIGFGGFVEQLGGALLPIPFNWVDYTSDNVGVMILANKQTLRIAAGATLDHEGGKCWVDYTK